MIKVCCCVAQKICFQTVRLIWSVFVNSKKNINVNSSSSRQIGYVIHYKNSSLISSLIKGWILMVLLSYASMALAIKWFANRYKTSTNPVLRFLSDYCASICKCLSWLRSKKVCTCCSYGYKLAREFI